MATHIMTRARAFAVQRAFSFLISSFVQSLQPFRGEACRNRRKSVVHQTQKTLRIAKSVVRFQERIHVGRNPRNNAAKETDIKRW
jgi:hypothetical protein